MHTPEQAQDLWCPMARIAQVGAVETHTSYNRFLSKRHVPVRVVSSPAAETFELGQEPQAKQATILETDTDLSGAAMCVADRCAAWRWGSFEAPPEDAEPGKLVPAVKKRSDAGYCGLAGKPIN